MTPINYLKIVALTFFSLTAGNLLSQTGYLETIQSYRDSIDGAFADPETTILEDDALIAFRGIPYYRIDTSFRVNALFEPIKRGRVFKMKTTTDRLPEYRPYGTLYFTLKGQTFKLTVYQNIELAQTEKYANYLFVPFTDQTNMIMTYGGGRYLDLTIEEAKKGVVLLDFNRCYNPYCAYNPRYSCPIPPSENHLEMAIEAGVQYPSH